jgi:hypothetical protein
MKVLLEALESGQDLKKVPLWNSMTKAEKIQMLKLIDEDTKKEEKRKAKKPRKRKREEPQPNTSAPATASLAPFGAYIKQMMTGFGDGFYTRPETAIQIQHAVQLYMKAVVVVAVNLTHLTQKGDGKQKQQRAQKKKKEKKKLQRAQLLQLLPQECDSYLRWKAMKKAQTASAGARFAQETALEVLFSDSEDEHDGESEFVEENDVAKVQEAKGDDKERVMARLHERLRFANDRTHGMDYETYMSFAKCRESNFLKERKGAKKFWEWLTDPSLNIRAINVGLGALDMAPARTTDAARGASGGAASGQTASGQTASAGAANAGAASGGVASGGAATVEGGIDAYPLPSGPLIKLLGYLAYDW